MAHARVGDHGRVNKSLALECSQMISGCLDKSQAWMHREYRDMRAHACIVLLIKVKHLEEDVSTEMVVRSEGMCKGRGATHLFY